jgi:uncharacterized protein (DUF302 family)
MSGAAEHGNGLVSVRSSLSMAETVKHLVVALERRGMVLFARIDHAKAASEVGLKLRPEELFVFGYPEAEAPLIAKYPLLGVDFPQRLLVREDEHGGVWISYASPVAIGRRLGVEADVSRLEAIADSLAGIAAEAVGKAGS